MDLRILTQEDWPSELARLGLTGFGAEVGVYRGDFSKNLLEKWPGKRLYLIDSWRHVPGAHDAINPLPPGQLENMAQTFRAVYAFAERAVIIRDLSRYAAQLFPDGLLDFVYIDAGHDYKNVSEDLMAWVPKVKKGGLVAGDDYTYGTWSHGKIDGRDAWTDFEVKPAVDDFLKNTNWKLRLSPEEKAQWWFFKD